MASFILLHEIDIGAGTGGRLQHQEETHPVLVNVDMIQRIHQPTSQRTALQDALNTSGSHSSVTRGQ
jgi:hypothetical protein